MWDDRRRPISMNVGYVSGHMTERSNERKGFKYLSVYSKQAQAAIKNINAKKRSDFFPLAIWSSSGSWQ